MKNRDDLIINAKRIHMIGVGGSGMCPLAEILHSEGFTLSGSDVNESDPLKRVRALGVDVKMGHAASNVHGADLVVYSAAISKDNPELVEADKLNIPTMERSEMLGAITRRFKKVIGVCGTHGKTTTSSAVAQVLIMNGYDPTAVIGGRLPLINANGRAGKSDYMVCESCEFVDTFLKLSPHMAVLLNIDNDHLDYFKTMDNLVASFAKFLELSKVAVINGDDELCVKAASGFKGEKITFGQGSHNDYTATDIEPASLGFKFKVNFKGEYLFDLSLSVPGKHNVMNALSVVAACRYYGVPDDGIKKGLEAFGGAGRRFEKLGEFNGIMLVDDYAHHPTEIKATLNAAKQLNFKNVIAVFQPFTFSRTELLKNDFIDALSIADKVILTPIMGSREVNTSGIMSEHLAEGLRSATCVSGLEEAASTAVRLAQKGDIIITMGGGDIYKSAYMMREMFNK
ncbi:MAG: UDP-N-acetylmuramate--L-alanine ligase [Ruminococcaceae bacterium]|nr:UDP-N-acetylmuramate--L-alanine ligase [Oscillospiraceae bacterium]